MKHLDEKLPALMATSEKTVASFEGVASPGSQLNETLRELSEAARAVRGLAETLERQPDALLYGKSRQDR
jgi:paraquat-inducible protein B